MKRISSVFSGVIVFSACVTRSLRRELISNEADIGNNSLEKKITNSEMKQDTFRSAVGELLIGKISRFFCRVRHIVCQT